jgi:penicillin-binding protein 1A
MTIYKLFNKFAKSGLWTLISLLMLILFSVASLYLYMLIHLPSVKKIIDIHLQAPLRVYSSDGKLMAEFGTKRRIPIALNEVPQKMIEAFLATEDSRFFEHNGVDFISLVRAAKAVVSTGKKVQGASTITMQVVRNFFLDQDKTYVRKLNEMLLALRLEQTFDKRKILELYLNKIYFGKRAYGVAAAAKVYYGKSLDQLTLSEMAMLAGLPQAPSRNNPVVNPVAALKRRNHVLERMLTTGCIDQTTYEQAVAAPVTAKYYVQPIELKSGYVSEMVRNALVKKWSGSVYESGWSVYTTVSSVLQQALQEAFQQGLIDYSQRHGFYPPTHNLGKFSSKEKSSWQKELQNIGSIASLQPAAVVHVRYRSIEVLLSDGEIVTVPWSGLSWARHPKKETAALGSSPQRASDILKSGDVIYLARLNNNFRLMQFPKVQGAATAIHPHTGAILALTGGVDFNMSNFNRALQARRQAGSSFKPFIYSAALDKGYTLASVINDAPIVLRDSGENEWWRPQNANNRFDGPTRLRVGLMYSRNLVSIRLLQMIGVTDAVEYVQRFGFQSKFLPRSLSLALGTASVTPLEMAAGYAVFANGGYFVAPYFIQRINNQDGEVIYEADPVNIGSESAAQL